MLSIEKNKEVIRSWLMVFLFITLATLVGAIFQLLGISETNIVVVYILIVLLSARLSNGYRYGIIAAILSMFSFNYFFTVPYFTFRVDDPGYFVTFLIMTITAMITSAVTTRFKVAARDAARKEKEVRILYQLTNQLTDALELDEIAKITTNAVATIVSENLGFICCDEQGEPRSSFLQKEKDNTFLYREVENKECLLLQMNVLKTPFFEGEEFCDWPIQGRITLLGILRIPKNENQKLNRLQIKFIQSMLETTALAMGRLMEANRRIQTNEAMVQERYRSNLLRSISHDIRTPLTGIMGSAEILMDLTKEEPTKYELSNMIFDDATWLRSLVENILNLTKLQDGKMVVEREIEALEDIVGIAIDHFLRHGDDHDITVDFPEEILMVRVDVKLIIQLLINLLDNARKHSPPKSSIHIGISKRSASNEVEVSVMDCGKGILEQDLPHIFQLFYTSKHKIIDGKLGIGIGLTICEAIVHAHNGTIIANNREDHSGAIFRFTLPLEEITYESIS